MPRVQLRAGGPDDLRAMYELDLLCFDAPFRFDLATMARYAAAANAVVVVADDGGAMIGFVILNLRRSRVGRAAYVTTLDVHPDHRREGIASVLLAEAEAQTVSKAVRSISLHVFCDNTPAVRFYERQGYTRTQRLANFYGPALDAWEYSRSLTP